MFLIFNVFLLGMKNRECSNERWTNKRRWCIHDVHKSVQNTMVNICLSNAWKKNINIIGLFVTRLGNPIKYNKKKNAKKIPRKTFYLCNEEGSLSSQIEKLQYHCGDGVLQPKLLITMKNPESAARILSASSRIIELINGSRRRGEILRRKKEPTDSSHLPLSLSLDRKIRATFTKF